MSSSKNSTSSSKTTTINDNDNSNNKITRKDFLKLIMGSAAAIGLGSVIGPHLSKQISAPSVKHDPSTAQMTYLSKLWWVWASILPADMNPSLDRKGDKAVHGNLHSESDVFFLPQGFDSTQPVWASPPEMESKPLPAGIVRHAKIRAHNKALFFPLNTSIYYLGIDGDETLIRKKANADIDQTYSKILKLESSDPRYPLYEKRTERVIANDLFMTEFGDPSIFRNFKAHERVKGVTAGIWCLTTPLHKGVTYDVTYGAQNTGTQYGGIPWHTEYRFILEVI